MSKKVSIEEFGVSDILCTLPDSKELDSSLVEVPDIFVGASGFERRTIFSIKDDCILSSKLNNAVPIIGVYDEKIEQNKIYLDDFKCFFSSESIEFVNCYSPSAIQNTILKVLESVSRKKGSRKLKVLFDISCSASTYILCCMHSFMKWDDLLSLTIIYCEAEKYFPEEPSSQEEMLQLVEKACELGTEDSYAEYGIDEPLPNELFQGYQNENRSDFVIAIPSFRSNRLERCIGYINPELLTTSDESIAWIVGNPPMESRHWRTAFQKLMIENLEKKVGGISRVKSGSVYEACTADYKSVMFKLYEITESQEVTGKNKHLIDFGSKMQSIGISLFLSSRREVSVNYAQPAAFVPSLYSEEVGPAHMLHFENLGNVVKELQRIGTLRYEPFNHHFDVSTSELGI